MKNLYIILALFAGIMFFGCSQDGNISDPGSAQSSEPKLIKLPGTGGTSAEASNSFTFNVNGWEGAYQTMYLNFQNSNATLSANYRFPKNVFSGQKTITITFNNDYASAMYTPSPLNFTAPVIANITYSNLNLTNVDPKNVDFVYLLPSGGYEKVSYDKLEVIKSSGTIRVTNARLYHFSRYGFVE